MKELGLIVFASFCCLFVLAQKKDVPAPAKSPAGPPVFGRAAAFAVSAPAAQAALTDSQRPFPNSDQIRVRLPLSPRQPDSGATARSDGDQAAAKMTAVPMPTPLLTFNGISNMDNVAEYQLLFIPPDISGDVGPDRYVQAVNALVRIYDKTGSPITPPFRMSGLFTGLGTPCSSRDDGDVIVSYDPLADRWLLSQYCTAFPPFRQMIAVSVTGDPAGAYYAYEFVMPNVRLNDFPKISVWPDAYYMSTEEFLGSDYVGAGAFAFDRERMLKGDPSAGYIYFSRPSDSPDRRRNLLPSDLDGIRTPPTGMPAVFATYTASEYGDAQDSLRLFDFHADFDDPAQSTFLERPESPLPVAAFDPTSPSGRADISQPPPGEKLDSNSDRVNYRLAYRNLGAAGESLVFDQTVRLTQDPAPYRAGVRVYELRRSSSTAFSVAEQSTIGDTKSSRWIGSVAQDHQGNIAVGYNFVADEKPPSVIYSGRLATEGPGSFRSESSLVVGEGVQKAYGWRWGDYASLTVDPIDDCTFWLSGEYYTLASQNLSDFAWLTRIGSFRFPECVDAPRASVAGTVTDSSTGLPIAGASVTASAYSRTTVSNGNYPRMNVLPGSYMLTIAAHGYRSQSLDITLANGQALTQNFVLQPASIIETAGSELLSESCSVNGSPEPGESVTYNISLRNTGPLDTQSLTVRLESTGGVIDPSAPRSFGKVVSGGQPATGDFTFTIDPSVPCGALVTLTFVLQDGGAELGSITIPLQTGNPRVPLRENFDRTQQAGLPSRWTRSTEDIDRKPEYIRNWRVRAGRSASGPRSVFSPDLNHVGIGELYSPIFNVVTPDARLTFRNWYDLETTFLRNRLFDGSILEISINDSRFRDIIDAGGRFESGGYDGMIDSCCSNPLGGKFGWSGRSGIDQTAQFITTAVRLPAAAAGQKVQLRWRMGTDVGSFREGQYIDDVLVVDGYSCGCLK